MFELTRRHMPPTDVARLLDMVVVNVLVCNTDAHAKNYSIMIRGNGASLAPLYDVMCGEVWENVTKNLAQKIAGKSWGDYLNGRDWQLFARECGLNPKQVIDRVGALAKSVISEAEAAQSEVAAMPAGGHEILDQTRQAVERRARTLLAQLQELGGDPVAEAAGRAEEAEAAAKVSVRDGTAQPLSMSLVRRPGRRCPAHSSKCTQDVSTRPFRVHRRLQMAVNPLILLVGAPRFANSLYWALISLEFSRRRPSLVCSCCVLQSNGANDIDAEQGRGSEDIAGAVERDKATRLTACCLRNFLTPFPLCIVLCRG